MSRRYFGTDGIRGQANKAPMTPDLAMRVGIAVGNLFRRGDHRHRVVIGKDTRLSGYMLESALVSGFTSVGMDVFQLGPMPTPAVAMLTRSMRADHRSDDFRLAQSPMKTMASSCSGRTATNCPMKLELQH
jgi:phosphoglucosamine mutase